MKGILTTTLVLLVSVSSFAQNRLQRRIDYIEKYKDIAIREMQDYGIPASITLAQGILESGDGTSELARDANNHFGIKCHSDWEGERVYHDDDEDNECFRKYEHAEASFRDHSLFLKNRSRYSALFALDPYDYEAWAEGLKDAGYATNRRYPELLIGIIEDYELYKYDKMHYDEEEEEVVADGHTILEHRSGLSYVIAYSGDNWNRLSLEVDVAIDKLIEYNDLTWDTPLEEGMIIFIERKNRRGYDDTHRVGDGETMHSISQKYGMRLMQLYKRNNMLPGEEPRVGETLVLRGYRD
ncbi:MAG: glucosaminidase domain-containing protein [Flavobacteriia bacterium]|nr:glucosaminidase domain-containing protein [Flavobacteriia bacterium]